MNNNELCISFENVSKMYSLGVISTGTLSHDLRRWWYKLRKVEDPYLNIFAGINRISQQSNLKYIWALRNVSFQIKKGETVGIIGKNGAGKTTTLKILSRITRPTKGIVKIKGKVASLLEVGTGFHLELTGRENIFLNGAILGMTKQEIRRKFDEIVEFSGVGSYIDTPVKRYSSGMQVRLAFAVAAHLEPDILLVDEVLAVGDADFQKKAIGKMQSVTQSGERTVLFVSHNLSAINSLCSKCIYLKEGELVSIGNTEEIISQYLSTETANKSYVSWDKDKPGDGIAFLHSARIIDENFNTIEFVPIDKKFGIEFIYEVVNNGYLPLPTIYLLTAKGEYVFTSSEKHNENFFSKLGIYKTVMWVPANLLNEGAYMVTIAVCTMNPLRFHISVKDALSFEVIEDVELRESKFTRKIPGIVRPKLQWETKRID